MRLSRPVAVAIVGVLLSAGVALTFSEKRRKRDRASCTWLAGDLDVHSAYTFTRISKRTMEDVLVFAPSVQEQATAAVGRGLDFLAITDYYDVAAQDDPAFGQSGLVWVPAYEHPFAGGAQLLGATQTFSAGDSLKGVRRVADQLREQGGAFQIGQSGIREWAAAYGTALEPDAVEVWFSGPWAYDPGGIGKVPTFSIRFYDELLDKGYEVGATGGSNNQFRGVAKLAGPGQPTTWVCASAATPEAVISAVRSGRTTISHEYPTQGPLTETEAGSPPPDADRMPGSGTGGFTYRPPDTQIPFVSIEAQSDSGTRALLGDRVAPGTEIKIGVFNAPFSMLRLVTDGSRVLDQIEVFSPTFVHRLRAPESSTWIRAEVFARSDDTIGGECDFTTAVAAYCSDRIGMLALSSPIYVASSTEE